MRLILVAWFLLSSVTFAADYKSAQRLAAGDVISADVFNDILDRIELTLKEITPSEMVGSWSVQWKTCVNGGPGNCNGLDVGIGWSDSVDNLYKSRSDTWVIESDGDGTYSVSMQKCFAGAVNGTYFNDTCSARLAVDSGILLLGTISGEGVTLDPQHSSMYNIKRVSDSRFSVWRLNSGSNSFVSFTLDKNAQPPEPPSSLSAVFDSGSVVLSWTENDENVISYSILSKDDALDDFTELDSSTIASYTDVLPSGTSRWYRVFAVNADGASIGSNVIKVDNPSDQADQTDQTDPTTAVDQNI